MERAFKYKKNASTKIGPRLEALELGQKEMVSALLDRCTTIRIDGPSLRRPDEAA